MAEVVAVAFGGIVVQPDARIHARQLQQGMLHGQYAARRGVAAGVDVRLALKHFGESFRQSLHDELLLLGGQGRQFAMPAQGVAA